MDAPLNLQNLKNGLSKLTIREQVSHRLAAMVQSGILRTGDELPSERELAATLEVSRETVRGAIQMLAAIGMVEISQGSRTRIARTEGFPQYNSVTQPVLPGRSADEVYQASGNELVAGFLHELFSFGMEYRRHVLLRKDSVPLSLADHIEILDGFERRDAAAAAEAMQNHLNRIHRTTLEAIAETRSLRP